MHNFKQEGDGAGINWPQTFVALGVVGVAAWGLWFFMRDRGDAPLPKIPTMPSSRSLGEVSAPQAAAQTALEPVIPPQAPAPAVIPPARSAAPLFLVGDPLALKSGQHYRAKLKLTGFQASLATRDLVQAQFLSNGFSNVIAYKSAAELPADWPSETKQGGSGVWWVEGDWTRESGPVARQEPITQVWEA